MKTTENEKWQYLSETDRTGAGLKKPAIVQEAVASNGKESTPTGVYKFFLSK